jgi:hypothetical protein
VIFIIVNIGITKKKKMLLYLHMKENIELIIVFKLKLLKYLVANCELEKNVFFFNLFLVVCLYICLP